MGTPKKTQKQQLEEKIRTEWNQFKMADNPTERDYFKDKYMISQNEYRERYGKDYLPVDFDMEVKI